MAVALAGGACLLLIRRGRRREITDQTAESR